MAVSSSLLHLFFFIFFFFFIIFVDGQCLDDQKKLLLHLKSELIFNSSEANRLVKWNETHDHDCCQWRGVRCDAAGHVIHLRLFNEGISGGIGESSSLFRFTHLSILDLSGNDLSTTQILRNIHRLTNLTHLDLSISGLVGPIPTSLAILTHLVKLDLSFNSLTSSIISMLSNLTHLVSLYLSGNSFTGSISALAYLTHLVELDLSSNSLTGAISSTLSNLTHLVDLDISSNSLTSSIPSFHMCSKLERIDLSYNYLMGSFSHMHFVALTNLHSLDLTGNSFNGAIPRHLFSLPSITKLVLSDNKFSRQINEFPIVNISKLVVLDLSNNEIEGHIPNSFFQLQSLSVLWLSNNLFDGTFQLQSIQRQLSQLYLSSCNMYDFPDLRNQSSLSDLELSNNHIGGDIPSWIWEIGIASLNLSLNLLTDFQKPYHISSSLMLLDLHSNQLRCEFPFLPQAHPFRNSSISYVSLANNRLTGVIPTSICNASFRFLVLDFSFNNLSGSIPSCLLENDLVLQVLNLQGNNIDGVIPDKFFTNCSLRTFDVSDNSLHGKIPMSLANCKYLAVMNVGNNKFDDSFPCMLPLSLRILVLRSNIFHGDLRCHKSWPNLQIMDISLNNFSGTLDLLNLSSWRGMMLQNPAHLRPNRSNLKILGNGDLYQDEVAITIKGVEVKLVKIWPDFTSIDLSWNNFQGDIPDEIGNLSLLYLLNLSNNALTGAIPKSLGALTKLGSLDLSANQLVGRIPEQLAQLTFLSVLNVSHNHLTGMIPIGPQFQTFQAYAFEENTGLCGFPLNTSCSSNTQESGATPSKSKDEEIEWDYVFVALGYVVGLGSIAWTLLCCSSLRERYFEKIEEVVDNTFYKRTKRRRHKRRVDVRNEVIRRHRHRG